MMPGLVECHLTYSLCPQTVRDTRVNELSPDLFTMSTVRDARVSELSPDLFTMSTDSS